MEAMVQEWTDGRLDELSAKIDRGFEQGDRRFDRVEGEMRGLRVEIGSVRTEVVGLRADVGGLRAEIRSLRSDLGDRLFALQRTMVQIVLGLAASMVVGFVGIFTLLLTSV